MEIGKSSSMSGPLVPDESVGNDARSLVSLAVEGKLDFTEIVLGDWSKTIQELDSVAESEKDYQLLGSAREIMVKLADVDETDNWLVKAEQIWHLKNDRKVETKYVPIEGETKVDIKVGEVSRHLWEWAFAWCEDWPMVCEEVLNMSRADARLSERIWAVYGQRLGMDRLALLRAGRAKLILALSTIERSLEDGQVDEELSDMLFGDEVASWAEIRIYIQGLKGAREDRRALQYDGETIMFWDQEGLGRKFATLKTFEPPEDLERPDKVLWKRQLRSLIQFVGGEE